MAWNRPTLGQIIARVETDIIGALDLVGALVMRSVEYVLARALAGLSHEMNGRIDYLATHATPWNSEGEDLRSWAALFTVFIKPAAWATGLVTVSGAIGASAPTGTVFVRADGARFTSTADVVLVTTSASIPVEADVAGAAGNTPAGVSLAFATPIAGLGTATVGVDTIGGGADEESDPALYARLQQRIANPPQGGAKADYIRWALEVPGVTRAWCYPLEDETGAAADGEVTVRFVRDNDASILPDAGEVATVLAYITADYRAPATAIVHVVAPTSDAVDMSIDLSPNTAETRAAVTANLLEFFARVAEPGGTLPRSKYLEAVSLATGVLDSAVTTPAADVTEAPGVLAVPGTFTFGTL